MSTVKNEIEDFLKIVFKEDCWDGMGGEIEATKAKIRARFELESARESGLVDSGEFWGAVVHSGKNGVNLLAEFPPEMLAHLLITCFPKSSFVSKRIVPRGLEFWPC